MVAIAASIALLVVQYTTSSRQGTRTPYASPGGTSANGSNPSAGIAAPIKKKACENGTLVGRVIADEAAARITPSSSAAIIETFPKVNQFGIQQVFDLRKPIIGEDGTRWFPAILPMRPNGTMGFLPAPALGVSKTDYRLVLEKDRFRLTLFRGCKRVKTYSVGIGTGDTPTPLGRFYLTGLFAPSDPNKVYGQYVFTLSAFSEVLTNWQDGGIVGLHGTNDPGSVGRQSSHGCIRMYNHDISELAKLIPLGTPITIR